MLQKNVWQGAKGLDLDPRLLSCKSCAKRSAKGKSHWPSSQGAYLVGGRVTGLSMTTYVKKKAYLYNRKSMSIRWLSNSAMKYSL